MKFLLDQNDREFLERLHRLGPSTVQEICDDFGVTATAVRQRLLRLLGMEMVERKAVRSGRGRPHHTYRVSDAGMRQLGDNYAALATTLWRAIHDIEPVDVREQVVKSIRDSLVDRYRSHVTGDSVGDRMVQLRSIMEEQGFDVETDTSHQEGRELVILRENNCPYTELAQKDSSICELEQDVFEGVLGARVELTKCCLDGSNCCEFQASVELGTDD